MEGNMPKLELLDIVAVRRIAARTFTRGWPCLGWSGVAFVITTALAWAAIAAVQPFGLPWPMLGRNAEHGGHAVAVGPQDPSLLPAPWPYVVPGAVQSQPVIAYDGTAFVGGGDGALHAVGFNARGAPIYVVGAPIAGSPAVFVDPMPPGEGEAGAPPSVYFGADDHAVHAVLADGQLK